MYLEDCLTPTKSLMLVREDPRSDIIAVLADGQTLIRPQNSGDRQRTRSGVVTKAGPRAAYKPGTRVLYSAFAATTLGSGAGNVAILDSGDVNAYLDGEEGADSEPGPAWIDHLRPPPGELLVRRAERPMMFHHVIIPEGSSWAAVRCMEAEVVALPSVMSPEDDPAGPAEWTTEYRHQRRIDKGIHDDFPIGHHVLLSPDVCRTIQLDLRGEHLLSRLDPGQIMCHILEQPELPVELDRDYAGVPEALAAREDVDERFNEGDPTGPRT